MIGREFNYFMKIMKWLGLLTAAALPLFSGHAQAPETQVPGPNGQLENQTTTAAPSDLSPGAAEVIRLAESGSGDDVVLAYIRNSQSAFNLSADHILYLKDLGLSSSVLSAMLTHDTTLRTQGPVSAPAPVSQEPVAAPLTPPVQQTEAVYANPPEDVSYFYNDLSPYGAWVQLGGIGWCWQPGPWSLIAHEPLLATAVIGFYSDCGWYWASDYSWGWAPFHYGRCICTIVAAGFGSPTAPGACLGHLALRGRSLWLGSPPSACALRRSLRPALQRH